MSTLPTPRPASLRTKLIRQLVAAYFGHQVRRRKPPHAPGQVREHPYGPNRAERLEYIEPAAEAPTRAVSARSRRYASRRRARTLDFS